MKKSEKNVFDWASEQLELNNKQNVYKGAIENQRQDYNIKCLEILAEGLKKYPNQTFIKILLKYGLLSSNLQEESNSTLGRLREQKRMVDKWDKLAICNGLNLDLDEKLSSLYEYNSMKEKIDKIYETLHPSNYSIDEITKITNYICDNLEEIQKNCDVAKINNIMGRIHLIAAYETGRHEELNKKIDNMSTEEFIEFVGHYNEY